MARRLGLLLLLLVPASCSLRPPSRCEVVCAREADCARLLRQELDSGECVQACAELDRDPKTQPDVERHVKCVQAAGDDCAAALECP